MSPSGALFICSWVWSVFLIVGGAFRDTWEFIQPYNNKLIKQVKDRILWMFTWTSDDMFHVLCVPLRHLLLEKVLKCSSEGNDLQRHRSSHIWSLDLPGSRRFPLGCSGVYLTSSSDFPWTFDVHRKMLMEGLCCWVWTAEFHVLVPCSVSLRHWEANEVLSSDGVFGQTCTCMYGLSESGNVLAHVYTLLWFDFLFFDSLACDCCCFLLGLSFSVSVCELCTTLFKPFNTVMLKSHLSFWAWVRRLIMTQICLQFLFCLS